MRQFVCEEQDELDGATGKKYIGSSPWDCKIVYRKQRPVRTLAPAPKIRQGTTDLRKAAVTFIIKSIFFTCIIHSLI